MRPIDPAALARDLDALAKIGVQPSGGITRLALTREDAAARDYVADRLRTLGCEARIDEIGNLRGRRAGLDARAPAVWTGSHLDSVPEGGRYDGAAGVVVGVAALQALADEPMRAPIEVVSFMGEEGSRFPRGTLGSAVVAGHVSMHEALALVDTDGVSVAQALAAHGGQRTIAAAARAGEIASYVELHVEQGGTLEAEKIAIGVVDTIAGLTQLIIRLQGEANHAGATPMNRRRDALAAAAEIVLAVERAAREVADRSVATVGDVHVEPGAYNIVPGRVELRVDMRAPSRDSLAAVEQRIRDAARDVGARRPIEISVERRQHVAPGPMSPKVMGAIENACRRAQRTYLQMPSGAVHDALHMADVAPTGMMFVPSVGGRSHCPEEATSVQDLAIGAEVLAWTLLELAS